MAVDDHQDDICLSEHILANGDRMIEVGNAGEILTRIELDLAYCSEKVLNLDILTMHVASRLSDYEALNMENSSISSDATKKAFEFDTLSGFLDSETKELDNYMTSLQTEIVDAGQKIQASELFKASDIEEKLQVAEGSLRLSQEQVVEIRIQSTKFERTLGLRWKEIWNGEGGNILENSLLATNDEWKMQTVEHQRHILQLLEKSLARELDLEKKLTDSNNNAGIKSKLHLLGWENACIEESTAAIQESLSGSENVAEVVMEISKELMSRPESVQSNSSGSVQWEHKMRSKLQESMPRLSAEELENFLVQQTNSFRDHLKDTNDKYISANSETLMLKEKVNLLEEKLRESDIQLQQAKDSCEASEDQWNILQSKLAEMDNVVVDLQGNIVEAESRAEGAEAKCTLLSKTNLELNKESHFVRSSLAEKVNLLESTLKKSDAQLEHANAVAKAIEEEQSLVRAALSDREILIGDLKAKVSKAEVRAESAESKCASLTETNLELSQELSVLRSRVECLERSLHQGDKMKAPNAKDIRIRTTIVTYLVMKLVLERECLQAQMSGLKRNKTLGKCNHRKDNVYTSSSRMDNKDEEEFSFIDSQGISYRDTNYKLSGSFLNIRRLYAVQVSGGPWRNLDTNFPVENSAASVGKTGMDNSETGAPTKPETVRSIEIRQQSSKNILFSSIVTVLSICGMYIFQLKCSLR